MDDEAIKNSLVAIELSQERLYRSCLLCVIRSHRITKPSRKVKRAILSYRLCLERTTEVIPVVKDILKTALRFTYCVYIHTLYSAMLYKMAMGWRAVKVLLARTYIESVPSFLLYSMSYFVNLLTPWPIDNNEPYQA